MDALVIEGNFATFGCTSTGIPGPVQAWLNSALDVLTEDSGRFFVEGDFLLISSVQQSDSGTYTCQATNVAGQAQATAELTVVGKICLHTGGQSCLHTLVRCTH